MTDFLSSYPDDLPFLQRPELTISLPDHGAPAAHPNM